MLVASLQAKRNCLRISSPSQWVSLRHYSVGRERGHGSRSQRPIGRSPVRGGRRSSIERTKDEEKEAGLYEQLFGMGGQEKGPTVKGEADVPRIPLQTPDKPAIVPRLRLTEYDKLLSQNSYQTQVSREFDKDTAGISVLVLRNASKNLVEEDFRRLIPQGSHLEGWTLEQGDIVKVIPGRDPITLEQSNYYYLLFSSSLSAFTYQGHATRVHKIVASHTPSSILSPMMPSPGMMANNMDANAAIQSFSLVAPTHPLDLRQLKPPLTPVMQAIVRNRGFPFLVTRDDRMPFEARLTLEGPQLHVSALQHLFMLDGKARELSWFGNDSKSKPIVTQWTPSGRSGGNAHVSPMARGRAATAWGDRQGNVGQAEAPDPTAGPRPLSRRVKLDRDDDDGRDVGTTSADDSNLPRDHKVYIIGFGSEKAMQSFVHYWHRREMRTEGMSFDQTHDLAPIVNVEPLW